MGAASRGCSVDGFLVPTPSRVPTPLPAALKQLPNLFSHRVTLMKQNLGEENLLEGE